MSPTLKRYEQTMAWTIRAIEREWEESGRDSTWEFILSSHIDNAVADMEDKRRWLIADSAT